MATTDLDRFTTGEERFGENVARTQRILAKLLLEWTSGTDAVCVDGVVQQRKRSHLKAIYFDKLCELICRVWNRLHVEGKVRYPACLTKRRGFHGPGRALRIDRAGDQRIGIDPDDHRHNQWAFTTEIAEKLTPMLGRARQLFVLSGDSWKASCRVAPGIDATQWEAWLAEEGATPDSMFLSPPEVQYVEALGRCVGALSDEQLRALGTHCTASETLADIRFNLDSWTRRFDDVTGVLGGRELDLSGRRIDCRSCAYVMVTTAREVRQKACVNERAYAEALEVVRSHCDSPDVGNAIESVQHVPAAVWRDRAIEQVSRAATALLDLSVYTRRGLNELGIIPVLDARELAESEGVPGRLARPFPNVVFNVPEYGQITVDRIGDWCGNVARCKTTLLELLPRVADLTEYGIPN